jgi:hypothetical protein
MGARTPGTDQRGVPRDAGDSGVVARHSVVLAVTHATAFLAGVWLVLSPSVLDQRVAGLRSALCAGAVLVVSGAVPLVEPRSVRVWRPAQLVAGAWLVTAPFALGQDAVAAATRIGAVLVGAVVLVPWSVGAAVVFRTRRGGERKQ